MKAVPTPTARQEIPPAREESRKLPDLPFRHEYDGSEDYYVRECYEEYYPLVEKFVLAEDDCLTVTGTPGIGKSVFYAYFFEEFWKAHRDEWVIVSISYENNGLIKEVAVFEDGVETVRDECVAYTKLLMLLSDLKHRLAKVAKNQDGRREEAETRSKKILHLCDGTPEARRANMVVFTKPNDEWFEMNETDDNFLFMPLWTPDELQKAALVLDLGLDDAEIDKRVEIFGGTARFCLSRDTSKVTQAKNDLLKAIGEISDGNQLQNLLLRKISEDIRHCLLHMEPLPDDKGDRMTKLASSFVRTKLEGRLQMLDFIARGQLRKLFGSRVGAVSLSEWIFEVDSHEMLRQGCELRLKSLPDGGAAPRESTRKWTTSTSTRYLRRWSSTDHCHKPMN